MTRLTGQQIAGEGLTGWAYFYDSLETRIATPDFAAGLALVAAIGATAEQAGHHPDINLRRTHVEVRLNSPDERGVTSRDMQLARAISALAANAGLCPASGPVSRLDIALDTPRREQVMPFREAVFGLVRADDPGIDLTDPADKLPTLWFQQSGDEEPRQRWHHDLWIDPAEVQPRIDAAIAAGSRLVSDQRAPAYWVLADPEGNKICLSTWQNRDDA